MDKIQISTKVKEKVTDPTVSRSDFHITAFYKISPLYDVKISC